MKVQLDVFGNYALYAQTLYNVDPVTMPSDGSAGNFGNGDLHVSLPIGFIERD